MNILFKIISAFLCVILMSCSFSVFAAVEKITTSDVTVKSNRLFEVKVGLKSSRTLTAARFTLSYNPDDVLVRQPVCNFSRAKVKFIDNNGVTDIIFLCSDGVKCSEFPTLFTMKYKKLGENNTKITINASDCVDNNLKNFTPPKSVVCNIKADSASSAKGKSAGNPDGSGEYGDSDNSDNDDILETSGESGYAEDGDDDIEMFAGENSPLYSKIIPAFIAFAILIFAALILYQNIQLKKEAKRRNDESEQ